MQDPESIPGLLADLRASLNTNLHTAQKGIGPGDHWVRFVDLRSRIVEFGLVSSVNEPENLLIGTASSLLGTDEFGATHRAYVWPISRPVYEHAEAVDWRIDDLPPITQYLLRIAWSCYRAHQMTVN